jgi:hypothetical protein
MSHYAKQTIEKKLLVNACGFASNVAVAFPPRAKRTYVRPLQSMSMKAQLAGDYMATTEKNAPLIIRSTERLHERRFTKVHAQSTRKRQKHWLDEEAALWQRKRSSAKRSA